MTKEELTEIKSAAVRIHAASVAAGRWEPRPEWESKLMDIVCDISRAVEADKADRHARLYKFDEFLTDTNFTDEFGLWVRGSVEDHLADAVIDILDTVEGFGLTGAEAYQWQPPKKLLAEDGSCKSFPVLCLYMVEMLLNPFRLVGGFLNTLSALQWWSEAHGIDLRRHVQLKMKYNETRL